MKFCDKRLQNHLLNGGKIKRIFNNKDGKYCPILLNNDNVLVFADNEEYYTLTRQDLSSDEWEIVETKYNWDEIIKDKILCVFSYYEDFRTFNISTLVYVDYKNDTYKTNENMIYNYCKPFNYEEFNVAEDLKEYEI